LTLLLLLLLQGVDVLEARMAGLSMGGRGGVLQEIDEDAEEEEDEEEGGDGTDAEGGDDGEEGGGSGTAAAKSTTKALRVPVSKHKGNFRCVWRGVAWRGVACVPVPVRSCQCLLLVLAPFVFGPAALPLAASSATRSRERGRLPRG